MRCVNGRSLRRDSSRLASSPWRAGSSCGMLGAEVEGWETEGVAPSVEVGDADAFRIFRGVVGFDEGFDALGAAAELFRVIDGTVAAGFFFPAEEPVGEVFVRVAIGVSERLRGLGGLEGLRLHGRSLQRSS